jgi:dTDP-4-amino-4,6-dideoxygalactose transaminase
VVKKRSNPVGIQATEKTMNIPFVDLKAQYATIKSEIDAAIQDVLDNTAFVGGPRLAAFEEAFASYCQVQHCVGVGNGTDALFIALKTLGIGPGDEVITAANSFIATSEAITMAGAKVVFVDINPQTYNINVDLIEEKITPNTKAIIPVHLYGQPADMNPIREIANRRGLYLVGDAAQAHGSLYKGTPISQLSDITCFSFYPGKNLGAYGDGGAVVTDNQDWADQMRMFANHGRSDKYDHKFEGVNSRLDGIQSVILKVKLGHLDGWSEARRRNAYFYNEYLKDLDVETPVELDDVKAVYHLYVIRIDAEKRSDLQAFLKSRGVFTGIHYPIALPYLHAYRHLGHDESEFPVSLKYSKEILSLPMFPELTEEQIQYVSSTLAEFQQ